MYPALPFLNRICVKDYQLPNSDIVIEKGTKILFPTLGFHYDPEYFPEPNKFNPERFSDENKANIHPYSYIPFGEGPRNCIATIILLFYMKRQLTYWKRRNVPYLEPSFPFGNLDNPITNKKSTGIQFKEFYNEFKKMGAKCGGIYTYCTPILVPVDADLNRHMLVKDFQNFNARGFYSNGKDQPVSVNLFTVDGEKWRTLRTKFTPTFTSAKMKVMFELMLLACKTMDVYLQQHASKKTPLNIKDCVSRMTTNIIGSCAFGIDCNSFKDTTFYKLLRGIADGTAVSLRIAFCNAVPEIAQMLRMPLFPINETNSVCRSIEETIAYRNEKNLSRNDFLQMLMEMKSNDMVDMDELKGQCVLFFLAGFETSATTMTFMFFELARNQDIQDKLREEINDVLLKFDNQISYEAVMSMTYLEMVMFETLRMYPALPFLNRICVKDYQLPNSDIVIEKGTKILFPTLGFHYDPEYFPEPNKFNPERFSDENRAYIQPYSYIPFGEGPRNCIGELILLTIQSVYRHT
ncbi:cytochrome p450 [Holotrichia oblita]|uniref:Cytochrome p450 n=1 Tax=Holotrichia oblita TaxID=644536 RepID=A0ACB9T7W7_HOLOL|nr:cytochrome p450 [Holotrichia oblita]